mmetsp:Transcript_19687/g.54958  ORF Transcript_19687/g.54958 Transcript_19687/m.54958 type:complete len:241 (+) Transcript_19687:1004-1726(+)
MPCPAGAMSGTTGTAASSNWLIPWKLVSLTVLPGTTAKRSLGTDPAPSCAAEAINPALLTMGGLSAASSVGSCMSSSFPWPSCPFTPRPHVNTCPSEVTTIVCRHPHASNETRLPASLGTTVGRFRSATSVRPSWPNLFQPQAHSVPSASVAMVCRHPPATPTMLRPLSASTSAGVRRSSASPWPSCPYLDQPNVYSCPWSVTTTLCLQPQATFVIRRPSNPLTFVGTYLSSKQPSPRFP